MEVKIINYDDLGNGISKINNKVCFIKKGLKDEVVDIKIIKDKKNYSVGVINNIIEKSNLRIKPICPYYDKCGGCNFLHVLKEEEKNFKINKAINYFSLKNSFYETLDFNYRNKVTLHVKNGVIGLYIKETNDIIKIDYCYLLEEKINLIIKLLDKYQDNNFNGNIMIRVNNKQESLVSITGNFSLIDKLKKEELIDNLILNDQVIKGKSYFVENILDYKFKVSYKSFFQVNRLGLIRIINILDNFLQDKVINTSLDLYSGTSVLGIILSKYSKKVISVEENKFATQDANYNIELNNIKNLEVINSKVEDVIDNFKNIDLVLIDPARRGLDLKTINNLKIINSKYLIYIACSMDSLKRDLVYLKEDYKLLNLYLVDMFPKTNHVECVSVLQNKK